MKTKMRIMQSSSHGLRSLLPLLVPGLVVHSFLKGVYCRLPRNVVMKIFRFLHDYF